MPVLRFVRAVILSLLGVTCHTTLASPLSSQELQFETNQLAVESCGLPGYLQCSFSPSNWLPTGFCCPSASHCHVLDRGSTLLCCPLSADVDSCTSLEPIPCSLQLQNATLHPESQLKTTRRGKLPRCGGDTCCPFGYRCVNGRRGRYCELVDVEIKATLDEDEGVGSDAEGAAGVRTVPFAATQVPAATSIINSEHQPPKYPDPTAATPLSNTIVLRRHHEGFDIRLFVMGFFCALGVASIAVLSSYFAVKYKWFRRRERQGRNDKEENAKIVSVPTPTPAPAPAPAPVDVGAVPATANGHATSRPVSPQSPKMSKNHHHHPMRNEVPSKITILPNKNPRVMFSK